MADLRDTGAGPSSIHQDFPQRAWKESVKCTGAPWLGTPNCKVVNIECIVPLLNRIGDLRVRAWFGIFKNVAIDALLWTSLFNQCTCAIFPAERRIIPWNSGPVATMAIIMKSTTTNLIQTDVTLFNWNMNAHDDALSGKFNMCRILLLIKVLTIMEAALLTTWQGAASWRLRPTALSLDADDTWKSELCWKLSMQRNFTSTLSIWRPDRLVSNCSL